MPAPFAQVGRYRRIVRRDFIVRTALTVLSLKNGHAARTRIPELNALLCDATSLSIPVLLLPRSHHQVHPFEKPQFQNAAFEEPRPFSRLDNYRCPLREEY